MASKTIRELRTTIAQMDALFPALADKPSKQADLLIEKSSAQKNLSSLEADERETEQDTRIKELEAGHEDDARRIAELERQNAALCARPLPEAIKVPDPEHAAVRQENARLSGLLESVAGSFKTEHERAMMAIRVIQHCSADTAKVFVPMLGFTYAEYARMSLTHKTADQLNYVISAAQCEGPAVVFAKAALALREVSKPIRCSGENPFVPDNRSAEEKLREAKETGRQLRRSPAKLSAVELATREQERYRDVVDRKIFSGTAVESRPTQSDELF
jgi:hypothetical protein